jgi:hypothetical protein
VKATLAGSQASRGAGFQQSALSWRRLLAGFSGHFVQKFAGK